MQGPSKLFGLKENVWMTAPAFIFSGAMEAFIFVPLMPLILEAIIDIDKKKSGKERKSS